MFEAIFQDEYLLNLYKDVAKQEGLSGIAKHDLSHVYNVMERIESILKQLNKEDSYIEEAKLSAFLHDIGVVYGRENHAEKSYLLAKQYFTEKNINFPHKDMVLQAIKNHSNGFKNNSFMGLALLLSDKLDITKKRLALEGFTTKSIRQIQYIEDVIVDITDEQIMIRFIAMPQINFQ